MHHDISAIGGFMPQLDLKIPQRHASLLAVLLDFTIKNLLQDKVRGLEFVNPLLKVLEGKWRACTSMEEKVIWFMYISLVRRWQVHLQSLMSLSAQIPGDRS